MKACKFRCNRNQRHELKPPILVAKFYLPCIFRGFIQRLDGMLACHNIILGTTKEDNDSRLKFVLTRVTQSKISIKPKKRKFGVSDLVFVGFVIIATGWMPHLEHLQKLVRIRSPGFNPNCVHQLDFVVLLLIHPQFCNKSATVFLSSVSRWVAIGRLVWDRESMAINRPTPDPFLPNEPKTPVTNASVLKAG